MAKILIADDDPAVLDLMALILRDATFDVLPTPDGRAALAIVDVYKPDIVLLDMMMVTDGWQVAAALQATARRTGYRPKIVVVTAGWRAADAAHDIGAEGYCSKPFRNKELVAEISRVLALPA